MAGTGWLPAMIPLEAYGGDFKRYLEALYNVYRAGFITSKPTYPDRRWATKRHPVIEGKEATFWHLISEGKVEADRIPALRRCERLPWPRPMIDAALGENVRCWRTRRGASVRVLIAVDDFSYVIVLEDRTSYIMLWTAFYVEHAHRREDLQREWQAYATANGVWNG